MSANNVKWVRLGDYIEQSYIKNSDCKYGEHDAIGVNIEKEILPMRGNISEKDFTNFFIVPPRHFAYNPRGSRKLGLGYNCTCNTYIITFNDIVFRVKHSVESELLPEFLFLFLRRKEWDRKAEYLSWGSSTEVFSWDTLCETEIPLPDPKVQQELVDTYNGLKALAEQNEALIEPLSKACEAFIVDCKNKYPEVVLMEYIVERTEKNRDNLYNSIDARGVYCDGTFGETKANLIGCDLFSYKVVCTDDFAYSNRINIGSIALNFDSTVIVSPSYTVFRVVSNKIIPKFLFILLRRKEFLRSTLFYAIGTIKDDFSYERMQEVKIPLPPLDVQQSIVNVYNCLEEAKKIAKEAREKLKTLCPALVQRAANS